MRAYTHALTHAHTLSTRDIQEHLSLLTSTYSHTYARARMHAVSTLTSFGFAHEHMCARKHVTTAAGRIIQLLTVMFISAK